MRFSTGNRLFPPKMFSPLDKMQKEKVFGFLMHKNNTALLISFLFLHITSQIKVVQHMMIRTSCYLKIFPRNQPKSLVLKYLHRQRQWGNQHDTLKVLLRETGFKTRVLLVSWTNKGCCFFFPRGAHQKVSTTKRKYSLVETEGAPPIIHITVIPFWSYRYIFL